MDADEQSLIKDLFKQAATLHKNIVCQQTYYQDGITTMCRFDTNQILLIVQSLQGEADRALASASFDAASANAGYAGKHAASCRALCRQLMLHLQRALSEYESEDENGRHAPPSDIMAQFGLRDEL